MKDKAKWAAYMKVWRSRNLERSKEINRESRARNIEQRRAEDRERGKLRAGTEARRVANKQWREENKPHVAFLTATRRTTQKQATPAWANRFFMLEAYRLARTRTVMFGFKWNVDHIVPIQSDKVCGLHVEHNLQVIPAIDNIKKSNRHWPDMWEA